MYQLLFHPRTKRQLRKLPDPLRTKVFVQVEKLSHNPFENMDIKKLAQTKRSYRLRVGELRVIYEIDQKSKEIYVQEIGFRGQIY